MMYRTIYLLIYYGLLLPGATPAQSKQNLMEWLGAVVHACSATSFVYDLDGNRESSLFHRIKGPHFDWMTAALSSLHKWGAACTRAGRSCAKFYVVSHGGEGSC